MTEKPGVNISADALKDILLEVVKAARQAPEPTAEQKAEIEANKKMREEAARQQLQIMENRRADQLVCNHRRRDNTTNCTYVHMGNYLICKSCQAMIHPEQDRPTDPEVAKDFAHHFYDTRLFNEHYLASQAGLTTF